MDTSVTIIGLVIIALIAIPLYKVFKSSASNKRKINAILSQYPESAFHKIDSLNNKTYALDTNKKHFVFIDFNFKPEVDYSVDLTQIADCKLIPVVEAHSNDTVKIELEFIHKNATKTTIPVYHIEHDQITQICLHEDRELAKKWQQQIIACL